MQHIKNYKIWVERTKNYARNGLEVNLAVLPTLNTRCVQEKDDKYLICLWQEKDYCSTLTVSLPCGE